MAICSCNSGLIGTAVLALLLVPARYIGKEPTESLTTLEPLTVTEGLLAQVPIFDLVLTASLVLIVLFIFLCEWIQRKLMEKRIVKLNKFLSCSMDQLRSLDAQQEQLDNTLQLVQNATSEYNLLLYLLLRQHKGLDETPT